MFFTGFRRVVLTIVSLDGKQISVIERTLTSVCQVRPSPTAPAVAFVRDNVLTVAPLDGSTNRAEVATSMRGVYDWTPDGKALVYADGDKAGTTFQFANIIRCLVIDTNGVVAGEKQPLTMNASPFAPRVRCLPDGRVLFAGVPLQLPGPATGAGPAQFYVINPALGTNATPVALPAAAGSLPQDLATFVASPDGRQIAIIESGSDVVAVLDVATGALEVVSPKRGWKSKVLPAWRGTNELYFAALPASSTNRPELFRWRKGSKPRAISTNWPDYEAGTLLQKPEQ